MTRIELLAACQAAGVTLAEFCARTGYSAATVRDWGHLRHEPPRLVLPLLVAWAEVRLARAAVVDAERDLERLRAMIR